MCQVSFVRIIMKQILFTILKIGLRVLYAPLKLLKTKNQVVYLSRQSDSKSLDMELLERAIADESSSIKQIFRVRMIHDGLGEKIKYCFAVLGDMYYLATSKVAIIDTYSITVSCLKHKKSLKVIQMWHALGATKKFGWQAIGTKEGRDEKVCKAMNMHKNYDFVLAPSGATAKFYMQAFNVEQSQIAVCPLPRVDFITNGVAKNNEFFSLNPGFAHKKLVLYVPTFRDREAYVAQMLKTAFEDKDEYQLIISQHPLSKTPADEKYTPNGNFTTYDLMKLVDVIITDYSACAFEASLLMKPLYFFVPDYDEYMQDRGINVDLFDEMPNAVFKEADALVKSLDANDYDTNKLFEFKEKYVDNSNSSCAQTLARFVLMQM